MENLSDLELLNNFNWYYKDLFNWTIQYYKKGKRIVFFGEKKDDPNFKVVLKKIKVENNYTSILREIYFLSCCQKSKYYIKLVDIFLSDNKKYIFLVLKDEGVNLLEIIDYESDNPNGFDYRKIKDAIKWMVFQIVCGLYILHKTKLIHHDIKPGNILASSTGEVKICDFGSVDNNGTIGCGTICYESPNSLLGKVSNDKDDMWAVGIIMIELYRKKYPFFNYKSVELPSNESNKKNLQLKAILSKYKLEFKSKEVNLENDFNFIKEKIILNDEYENYDFKEELNDTEEILDIDALNLIKNLLKINPKNRYSAEQALNSKYLAKFKNYLKDCRISYKESDYNNILMNVNNKDDFEKNIELIKQKFIGEVLFE